jgi:hypothetical protein
MFAAPGKIGLAVPDDDPRRPCRSCRVADPVRRGDLVEMS